MRKLKELPTAKTGQFSSALMAIKISLTCYIYNSKSCICTVPVLTKILALK